MRIKHKVKHEFKSSGLEAGYLLALSGGLDSTVLFHLMLELELNFSVAHAQFDLRGKESEDDAKFVRRLCLDHQIQYLTKKFNVPQHMKDHKMSLQMSARSLRYAWFNELLAENELDFLVTAHHLNDSMETFLINLMRGTGIKGLTGIDNKGKIIRPIQSVSMLEIQNYANSNGITWREDATNAEDNYLRNKIRHHVIPAIEKIDPDFNQSFLRSISLLRRDVEWIEESIDKLRSELFIKDSYGIRISIPSLKEISNANVIFYLFNPYGFSHPNEIQKLLNANVSAEIESKNYRLIKEQDFLRLGLKQKLPATIYKIDDLEDVNVPISLRFKKILTQPHNISNHLDFAKIKFPISLRIRENGDKFYPSGMDGKSKKVSKLFKDIKLSKIEKENTWILIDADNNIIGIPGIRWDERFIATKETNIWLLIEKLD